MYQAENHSFNTESTKGQQLSPRFTNPLVTINLPEFETVTQVQTEILDIKIHIPSIFYTQYLSIFFTFSIEFSPKNLTGCKIPTNFGKNIA